MKKELIATGIFIILFLIFFFTQKNDFESSFQHEIIDSFISENKSNNFHFYFIEVSEYNQDKMNDIGNGILSTNLEKFQESSIIICYFFDSDFKSELPEKKVEMLKKLYPKKPNLPGKLEFYYKGFIFTSNNKSPFITYKDKKIRSGKLVESELIVPKKGTNAYFILFGAS
jgi:hypothetical protein